MRKINIENKGIRVSKTPEYYIWAQMRKRCNNKNHKDYPSYGGRGIKVCDRWNRFENFTIDMGERPTYKCLLDRINNNLGYYPENCRWITPSLSGFNRRKLSSNTSGKVGVSFCRTRQYWVSYGRINKKMVNLYTGKDLFEACCVRISWENENISDLRINSKHIGE